MSELTSKLFGAACVGSARMGAIGIDVEGREVEGCLSRYTRHSRNALPTWNKWRTAQLWECDRSLARHSGSHLHMVCSENPVWLFRKCCFNESYK